MGMAPAPKPEWTPAALEALMDDFDVDSMDLAIGADPKSVTDMQRMMRAQYLGSFLQTPIMAQGLDTNEIKRRMFEAASMDDIDKLFANGPDPMAGLQIEQAKADVKETKTKAMLNIAKAEDTRQEGMGKAFERGVTQGTMAGGVGGVEDAAADPGVGEASALDEGAGGGGVDQPGGAPGGYAGEPV